MDHVADKCKAYNVLKAGLLRLMEHFERIMRRHRSPVLCHSSNFGSNPIGNISEVTTTQLL